MQQQHRLVPQLNLTNREAHLYDAKGEPTNPLSITPILTFRYYTLLLCFGYPVGYADKQKQKDAIDYNIARRGEMHKSEDCMTDKHDYEK